MTWKRCDGCNRAIATNAFACDYCGHVCKDALSFLPSDDTGQPTTPWPADELASVEGLAHGAAGSPSDNRPAAGLPPLELNDEFPFAHVFERQGAPEVAPSASSERPGEDSGSDTLSSPLPVNDQHGSEDVRAAEKPYLAPPSSVRRFAPETKPAQDSMALDFASQLDEIDATLTDDYSHAGTAVGMPSEDDHSALAGETEISEDGLSSIPVAAKATQHPASPRPAPAASSAPAGQLGTRAVAMMGGALFAAAALIFTFLSMRGSASPESAAASAPAPGTPASNATRPAARAKAPAALPAVLPKWNVVTAGRWIGTDRKTVAFELQAVNKIRIWTRDVTPVLVVRCQAGRVDPFVFTQSAARMEAQDEDHTVRVAFDDGPETTERWPDSVDHDALFARDATGFTQQLSGARTLQFGFTPHNAEPAVARFEVGGLSDLLSSAPRQCGSKN